MSAVPLSTVVVVFGFSPLASATAASAAFSACALMLR
jgi:hypothetical protein